MEQKNNCEKCIYKGRASVEAKPEPVEESEFQEAARQYFKNWYATYSDKMTWNDIKQMHYLSLPHLRTLWNTAIREAMDATVGASCADCRDCSKNLRTLIER